MVRCWKCGRENEEGMRFCTNCGTPVTPPGQTGAGGGAAAGGGGGYDPHTSETISFNAPPQTAVGFGTPTTPYTARPFADNAPPPPPPPKSRTGLVVGIIAGVLLLGLLGVGGVAGYYYYANRKDVAVNNGNSKQGTLDPEKKATPTDANTNASPESSPEPSPTPKQQLFEPPTTPTKEGTFTVYANEGWQMSNIAVVPLEQFTTTVDGIVDVAGVKTGLRANGTNDAKFKSRRLFPEFPVGALIMRTRYADGRFSNMVAAGTRGDWQNLPDERGMLEFIINDNQPKDNGGQFTIKVKLKSVPKK